MKTLLLLLFCVVALCGAPAQPIGAQTRRPNIIFIYTEPDGMDELHDLQADPHEVRNLIDAPAAQAELIRLKAELIRSRRESS